MADKILFHEEQRFKGSWMWYLLLVMSGIGLIPVVLVLINEPDPTEGFIGLAIFTVVIGGVMALFTYAKLIVTIDSSALRYRFPPFLNREKVLTRADIQSAEIRTYSSIWEYGGYGYRYTLRNGRALNVSGDEGLQLVFKSGKRLLIGTQKREALERALKVWKDATVNESRDV